MGASKGDLRGSDNGMHPTRAWVELSDGREVACDLERTGPHAWTARPCGGAVVTVGRGDHLRIDRLGPGDQVTFENVLGEAPPQSET